MKGLNPGNGAGWVFLGVGGAGFTVRAPGLGVSWIVALSSIGEHESAKLP